MFALCKLTAASPFGPDTAPLMAGVDYKGFAMADVLGNHGAVLFSGTGAQLTAVNALANVVGICQVTETGARWPELDNTVGVGARTALNTWLTARSLGTVGAGMTNRQVINAIYKHFNSRFDADTSMDVTD